MQRVSAALPGCTPSRPPWKTPMQAPESGSCRRRRRRIL